MGRLLPPIPYPERQLFENIVRTKQYVTFFFCSVSSSFVQFRLAASSSEIAGRKLDAGKDYIYYKPNPGYFANICFAQGIQFFFGFIHPIGSLDKYGKIERYRSASQAPIVVGFDCFMPIFSI